MRKQPRPAAPAVLAENNAKWNAQWVALRQRNPQAAFQWYTVDGKTCREWILPELEAMTQGHCAFCDAFPFDDKSMEPIEHFRPKSNPMFHHLAFEWTNLYYACDRCQSSKNSQWVDELLAPDESGYEFSDFFCYELTTGELMPNPVATEERQNRARETIRVFDLDNPKRRSRRCREFHIWRRSSARDLDDVGYRDFIEAGSAGVTL